MSRRAMSAHLRVSDLKGSASPADGQNVVPSSFAHRPESGYKPDGYFADPRTGWPG